LDSAHALGDILKYQFAKLEDEALYRNSDRLHPNREHIERELAEREKTLFNLDDTVYLYDLTSTYFEGQAKANPRAKRGYSRDQRVRTSNKVGRGIVLDRDGFPKAYEIFDGNIQDRKSLNQMLDVLERRMGKRPGATVIVDRGLEFDENLEQIRKRGLHCAPPSLFTSRIKAWTCISSSHRIGR
jgi:transposase